MPIFKHWQRANVATATFFPLHIFRGRLSVNNIDKVMMAMTMMLFLLLFDCVQRSIWAFSLECIKIDCNWLCDKLIARPFCNIQINYHLRGLIKIAFSVFAPQPSVRAERNRNKPRKCLWWYLKCCIATMATALMMSTVAIFANGLGGGRFAAEEHLFNTLHELIKSHHINIGGVTDVLPSVLHCPRPPILWPPPNTQNTFTWHSIKYAHLAILQSYDSYRRIHKMYADHSDPIILSHKLRLCVWPFVDFILLSKAHCMINLLDLNTQLCLNILNGKFHLIKLQNC